MKVAFAWTEDGNFNCNTIGYPFNPKRIYSGSYLIIEIPDEIYNAKNEGKFMLTSAGFDFEELVHYFDDRMDTWILRPSDSFTDLEKVEWKMYTIEFKE